MNFILTEEQKALQELANKAARTILDPIINEDEEAHRFRPEIIKKLGELGLSGITIDSSLGGAGLGYFENALMLEELATSGISYAISVAVSGLPQVILNELGTQEQKQKYIPKLASGEWIGAFSLTEPNSGSDAASLKTKATRQGDYYIINGTKLYTTQGNYADVMIVFARTGGEGANGISAFVVEKNTPGLKVGKIENKMGANISQTCEMIFENVKVPRANLIGEENTGFKKAMNALNAGRINIAAIAVGLAKQAYSYALKYAKERVQFNKPIFEFQAIQFMLADMHTKIEASRLLVLKAAALKDSNLPFAKEASMAKLFATDTAMSVTTDAVQILGGNGYSREFPVERYMREAKVLQIVEGTNQIQRLVIAKNLV